MDAMELAHSITTMMELPMKMIGMMTMMVSSKGQSTWRKVQTHSMSQPTGMLCLVHLTLGLEQQFQSVTKSIRIHGTMTMTVFQMRISTAQDLALTTKMTITMAGLTNSLGLVTSMAMAFKITWTVMMTMMVSQTGLMHTHMMLAIQPWPDIHLQLGHIKIMPHIVVVWTS